MTHPTCSSSPAASELPRAPGAGGGEPQTLYSARLLQLVLVQLTFGFAFSTFFLLPKFLELELGATASTIGRVSGMGLATAVVMVPFVGSAIDKLPRRPLLVAGTLLGAVTALGHIWVDRVGPLLYLLRALQGASLVITINTVGTLVTVLAPPARLSQALGLVGTSLLCTNAIAPAVVEPIAARSGWALGFLLAAASASVATVLALRVDAPGASPVAHPFSLAPLRSRLALSVCGAIFSAGFGFGAMVTYTQPFALSLGDRDVSALFIGYTLSAIAVRVVLGSLADRVGRARIAFGAIAVYGSVVLATAWLGRGDLFPLGLGLGAGHGLAYPALNALALERVPIHQRGIVMTAFNGCFNLGLAVSVLGLGPVADGFGYPSAFVVAGCVALAGLVPLVPFLRTR